MSHQHQQVAESRESCRSKVRLGKLGTPECRRVRGGDGDGEPEGRREGASVEEAR